MKIIIGNQKGGVGKSTISTLLALWLADIKKERIFYFDLDEQQTALMRYNENKRNYSRNNLNDCLKELQVFDPRFKKFKVEKYTLEKTPAEFEEFYASLDEKSDEVQSIFLGYENSKWEKICPFSIAARNIDEYPTIKPVLERHPDVKAILDTPGNISNNNVKRVMEDADILICPFKYDEATMFSTMTFINIFINMNNKAKIFFLPNMIKNNVSYDRKPKVDAILMKVGTVLPSISHKVAFERINSLNIKGLKDEAAFEEIDKSFNLIFTY